MAFTLCSKEWQGLPSLRARVLHRPGSPALLQGSSARVGIHLTDTAFSVLLLVTYELMFAVTSPLTWVLCARSKLKLMSPLPVTLTHYCRTFDGHRAAVLVLWAPGDCACCGLDVVCGPKVRVLEAWSLA
jgi:hypothetical protein